jgi:penicillin-binding protein 1A
MKRVTGGSIPAAIWKDVMSEAHLGLPHLPLPGGGTPPEESLGPLAVNQDQDLAPEGKRDTGLFGSLTDLLGGRAPAPEKTSGRTKSSFDQVKERASNR